jgi:hypothetical protein
MATGREIKNVYVAMKKICQESSEMLQVVRDQFTKSKFQIAAPDSRVLWDGSSGLAYPFYWLPYFQQIAFVKKGEKKDDSVLTVNIFFDDPEGEFESDVPFVTCGALSWKAGRPSQFWQELYGEGWHRENPPGIQIEPPLYARVQKDPNDPKVIYYFLPLDVITSEAATESLIVKPLLAIHQADTKTAAKLVRSAAISIEAIRQDRSS